MSRLSPERFARQREIHHAERAASMNSGASYVAHAAEIDDYGIARCSCGWSYDPFMRSDVQYTREVADRHIASHRRVCWCGGEDGEHEADAHAEEGRW